MDGRRGRVFGTEDGRVAIRFVRLVPHPPEKVWRAITDPAQLAEWFPAVVSLDRPAGSELFFGVTEQQRQRFGMTDDPAGTPNGRILRNEPPSVLEYEWAGEILTWEITGTAEGSRLVFTNVLTDPDAAGPAAAGWEAGLEVVEAQLAGQPITWNPLDRAEELATLYRT
ncbi:MULTISPECIES: SRPBCC domain-containing protein [unclassified Kribbella]|uniref:SRPBCC domain-containing protein n=1 Tax=unclassified Kribbella TaxID=2644121 RepID=UPI00301AED98